MRVITRTNEMRDWSRDAKEASQSIGLVPTLGCLHKGHQHLLERARSKNDRVVLSVFVNPLQFRRPAFEVYPRDLNADMEIARSVGADAVFAPSIEQMYPHIDDLQSIFDLQDGSSGKRDPDNFTIDRVGTNNQMDYIRVPARLTLKMDGKLHPWHFDGVATIVRELFRWTAPTRAYFGEKDIQQLAILESLNEWLNTGIQIIRVPVIRDPDGLSASSRLVMLDDAQRSIAVQIAELLKDLSLNAHDRTPDQIIEQFNQRVATIPTGQSVLEIDSIECVDPKSLEPAQDWTQNALLYAAYLIDGIRLAESFTIHAN